MKKGHPPSSKPADDLLTFSDFLDYAITRFRTAKLDYGHGTDNPFDEAAFIIMEIMGLPPSVALEPIMGMRLSEEERQKAFSIIDERVATRKPAPYLLNRAWYRGFPFYVDERVIVPRSYIGELMFKPNALPYTKPPDQIASVLDLCTGSGCIAILAAHLYPNAKVDAVDLSQDALQVAEKNVRSSPDKDRIALHQGNLFEPLQGKAYDLILTNPPYVDAAGMADLPREFQHEPAMALAAGKDGLDLIHIIMRDAPKYMTEDAAMLCELGRCGPAMKKAFPRMPFLWLDTENSSGEVFWLTRKQMTP